MEFNAYLASSSDEGDGDDGDKVLRYKVLVSSDMPYSSSFI